MSPRGLFAPEKLIPVVLPDAKQPQSMRATAWRFKTASALLGDSRFRVALRL